MWVLSTVHMRPLGGRTRINQYGPHDWPRYDKHDAAAKERYKAFARSIGMLRLRGMTNEKGAEKVNDG